MVVPVAPECHKTVGTHWFWGNLWSDVLVFMA